MTQDKAIEIMLSGRNVFLTGKPGSGKSYTIQRFVDLAFARRKKIALTATTGFVAANMGGTTIHALAGLGVKQKLSEADIESIADKPWTQKRLCKLDILITDEISMFDAYRVNNLNKVLQQTRQDFRPFGGVQVIFVGDFFQLPPTPPKEPVYVNGQWTSKKGIAPFAFESFSWAEANFAYCYLHEQHRQSDAKFLQILSDMRENKLSVADQDFLMKHNPKLRPITHIYTRNDSVDIMNRNELDKIKAPQFIFQMEVFGHDKLVEMLQKQWCKSPENLVLKVGAKVMFTKNNVEEGYMNGTMGVVVDLEKDKIVVHAPKEDRMITVKKETWKFNDEGKDVEIPKASVTQYPLRLAWAITVHKSQGMTLDAAIVDLSDCFEDGQGYVAISRVRSLDGLFLEGTNRKAFQVSKKVLEMDNEFRRLSDEIEKQ